jgi:hypothetical protein
MMMWKKAKKPLEVFIVTSHGSIDDPSCYTAYRVKDTEGISYEAGFLPNLAPPYGTP